MKRPNWFPWKRKELRLVTEQTTIICFPPLIQEKSIQTLQEHFQFLFILLINKPCAAVLSGLQSTNPLLNQALITEFIPGASHGAQMGRGGWAGDLLLIPFAPAEEITGLLLDTDWEQALSQGWMEQEELWGCMAESQTGLGWKSPKTALKAQKSPQNPSHARGRDTFPTAGPTQPGLTSPVFCRCLLCSSTPPALPGAPGTTGGAGWHLQGMAPQ